MFLVIVYKINLYWTNTRASVCCRPLCQHLNSKTLSSDGGNNSFSSRRTHPPSLMWQCIGFVIGKATRSSIEVQAESKSSATHVRLLWVTAWMSRWNFICATIWFMSKHRAIVVRKMAETFSLQFEPPQPTFARHFRTSLTTLMPANSPDHKPSDLPYNFFKTFRWLFCNKGRVSVANNVGSCIILRKAASSKTDKSEDAARTDGILPSFASSYTKPSPSIIRTNHALKSFWW